MLVRLLGLDKSMRNCAVTIKHMTLYGSLLWVGRFTTTHQQWAESRLVAFPDK